MATKRAFHLRSGAVVRTLVLLLLFLVVLTFMPAISARGAPPHALSLAEAPAIAADIAPRKAAAAALLAVLGLIAAGGRETR